MRARTYVPLFSWSPLRFHWEPARAPRKQSGKATRCDRKPKAFAGQRARTLRWRGCIFGRDGSYWGHAGQAD